MEEEWRDIRGFEGYYQVSNLGRVRSLNRTITCSLGKSFKKKGKVLSMNKFSSSGYRICMLTKGKIRENKFFHRLVCQAFLPNPENKPFVNHIDNDKLNNNITNLEWSTPMENTTHAKNIGVIKNGLDHYCSKLSTSDVKDIYYLAIKGELSQKEIARLYGISQSGVSNIKNNKIWKSVGRK